MVSSVSYSACRGDLGRQSVIRRLNRFPVLVVAVAALICYIAAILNRCVRIDCWMGGAATPMALGGPWAIALLSLYGPSRGAGALYRAPTCHRGRR